MLELDRRGLPGVMLATEAFEEGARAQADAFAFDVAVVYTPHPIQNRTDAEIRELADRAYPSVLRAITAS